MHLEFKDPPPIEKLVVITMTLTQAKILRTNIRSLTPASPVRYAILVELEALLTSTVPA